jgi:hypothetical protein
MIAVPCPVKTPNVCLEGMFRIISSNLSIKVLSILINVFSLLSFHINLHMSYATAIFSIECSVYHGNCNIYMFVSMIVVHEDVLYPRK